MIVKHTFFNLMMSLGTLTSVKSQDAVAMNFKACMRYAVVYSSGFPIFAA